MARMSSPAGDMQITFLDCTTAGQNLVIQSRFGAWDAKIYFNVSELGQLVRMMLKGPVILFLLRIPFSYLAQLFSRPTAKQGRRAESSRGGDPDGL